MSTAIDTVSQVDFKPSMTTNDIDKAWDTTSKYLQGISIAPMAGPDTKKLLVAMTTAKKELKFVVSFDKDDQIKVTAVVGGKVVSTPYAGTISSNGRNQQQARATLSAMAKKGKLFSAGELAAWDKKHPNPDKVAELEGQRDKCTKDLFLLNVQVSRLQPLIKSKQADIARINGQLKTLGVDLKNL